MTFIDAVLRDDVDEVARLIEAGVDVDVCTPDTLKTPLMLACERKNIGIMVLLLAKNPTIGQVDAKKNSIVIYACAHKSSLYLETVLANVNVNDVTYLLKNSRNIYGVTPLIKACIHNSECVDLLLNYGVNVNDRNNSGTTALMIACDNKHMALIRRLLDVDGIEVDSADYYGDTPLMHACMYKNIGVAKALLAKGANIEAIDSAQHTVLTKACRLNNDTVVKMLLAHGASANAARLAPLLIACENRNPHIVELLLAANADVEVVDEGGYTPLIVACKNGTLPIVDMLLRAKAQPSVANIESHTPLMLSCAHDNVKIVERLLEAKADVNAKSNRGHTAIEYATLRGHKCIDALIANK
jgi:serine/threonine-protein phosphatase 6 regulatory ankyrin repeat subunit B